MWEGVRERPKVRARVEANEEGALCPKLAMLDLSDWEKREVEVASVADRLPVMVRREPLKVKFAESVNAPAVVMYGTRFAVSEDAVRFVEEAVPKYPVPETVSAVEEAYGNVLAFVAVEVIAPAEVMAPVFEMVKRVEVALAVELATTKSVVFVSAPLACTESRAQGVVVPTPRFRELVEYVK